MSYKMKENEDDLGVLVAELTAENHSQEENICNNDHFQVEYILRPVAETTLREFIDACVRNVSNFPEDWSLCTRNGDFNCDPVTGYVKSCEVWRARTCPPDSPKEPCDMGMVMSQSSGLLILFGLVIIGILIGISVTIAACLICPQIHGWANKKIRGEHYGEKSKTHPSHVFHLEALDSQPSSYDTGPAHVYTDRQVSNQSAAGESDSINEYTYIGGMGRARVSEAPASGDYEGLTRNNSQQYEGLARNNSQQQSHKYAHLPQNTPPERSPTITEHNAESPEYAHNYFVLEKNKDQ